MVRINSDRFDFLPDRRGDSAFGLCDRQSISLVVKPRNPEDSSLKNETVWLDFEADPNVKLIIGPPKYRSVAVKGLP